MLLHTGSTAQAYHGVSPNACSKHISKQAREAQERQFIIGQLTCMADESGGPAVQEEEIEALLTLWRLNEGA